jgi:type II secretory pathway pseudopilin PulG
MFSSRIVRTLLLAFGLAILGLLVAAFVAYFQAWQKQIAKQRDAVQTLALYSARMREAMPEVTLVESPLEITTEGTTTHTPFPMPWPVNAQGTPFNPFELTPILTIPVVNAQGTPLTPTPSEEDMRNWRLTPIPTSSLIVANTVDLAVGLPDDEIWLIVVLRIDGYIDEYRIPATQVLPLYTMADTRRYAALRDTIFQLKPGETILHQDLLTLLGELHTPTPGPPTPTPRAYVNRVNLAEGLPDREIWWILVLRADGNLDEYLIPAEQMRPLILDPTNMDNYLSYLAYRETIFQLKPGEMILNEGLLAAPIKGVPPLDPYTELTPQPTDIVGSSSQDVEPLQLHLPQVGN